MTTVKTWKKRFTSETLLDVKVRERKPKKLDPGQPGACILFHPDAYLSEIAFEFRRVSSLVYKALKN